MARNDVFLGGMKLSRKIPAVLMIVAAFLISGFFSFRSFTGYAITEEINVTANTTAAIFFLIGLAGAHFLLRKGK